MGWSQSRLAKFEIGTLRLPLTDAADLARTLTVSVADSLSPDPPNHCRAEAARTANQVPI
jgi:hypothetical protein